MTRLAGQSEEHRFSAGSRIFRQGEPCSALLVVARGLARRKRQAWIAAVGLFAVAAVVHLLKGPDPIPVLLDAGMLAALVWWRDAFDAHGDPRTLWDAVAFVPLYLLAVLLFGVVSLLTQVNHVTPDLAPGGVLRTIFGGLAGFDGAYAYRHRVFAEFFPDALLALGAAGLAILLVLLFRPLVQRTPPSEDERDRARRIVDEWGSDTLAPFALRRDKSYFFSADGRSFVAYAYVRGFALVAADPVGPPDATAAVLDEFLAFCRARAWRVAFVAVREADVPLYRARGLHGIYLGDEAILRCDTFTLDGPEKKDVRAAVRRVGRDHRFELLRESEASPELVDQLNEISARWRGKAPERGFTMELDQEVEGRDPEFVIALARDRDGRPAGFLRLVPCHGEEPGYSLDLMRRLPESVNGLTEFLIANAALELGRQGIVRLSLNFAAWGRLMDGSAPLGTWDRVQRRMARALNPYFQIQSLRDFNAKFDPEWLPRSIIVDEPGAVPKVALLWASVEGFLRLPVVGRLLVPPVRAAQRPRTSA
jgi:lysylphosphatidylglycerol synthetase-like protein (DUF2156 family)